MKTTRIIAVLAPLTLLVACGHDASRENPLDPELTPAVGLVAVVDDSAGVVLLSWDQYRGQSDFGTYVVLRNQAQSTIVDTLAGGGSLENLWYYVVGPLLGAAAAVPVFRMQAASAPSGE